MSTKGIKFAKNRNKHVNKGNWLVNQAIAEKQFLYGEFYISHSDSEDSTHEHNFENEATNEAEEGMEFPTINEVNSAYLIKINMEDDNYKVPYIKKLLQDVFTYFPVSPIQFGPRKRLLCIFGYNPFPV